MIGSDVVTEYREWAHPLHRTFTGKCPFPVGRAADVGTLWTPVVEWAFRFLDQAEVKHRVVDLAEHFRLYTGRYDSIDLFVAGPDVFEGNRVAVAIDPERIPFNIEAHGSGNGVGDHQWWRCQKGLFGIGMDTAIKVTIAGKNGGCIQIAFDHFLLDLWIECTTHAVTGGAGVGHDTEAEFFHFGQQSGFFQIEFGDFGAWCKRRFDPGFTGQSEFVGFARDQTGGHHVTRVTGIGTAGDRGNDDRTIRHFTGVLFPFCSDATCGQIRGRQAPVWIGGACHVTAYAGQVEFQYTLVFGVFQVVGPQPGEFGVLLDQCNLLRFTPGQFQIIDGLLIDIEHARRGTELRRHVGNGSAVTDGQIGSTCAEEFEVGRYHFLVTQKLGDGEYDIGGSNTRLTSADQFHSDDVGQAHHGGSAEHHGFGFQSTYADGDNAQSIDMRSMTVGTDTGIRIGDTITRLDHWRHLFQIDLVHDAVSGRDHIDILERRFSPLDKVKTVFVAAVFYRTILIEGFGIETGKFNRQRVIDDKLGRYHRIHLGRIATLICNRIAQAGQIHQRGLAQNIMTNHAGRIPRKIQIAPAFDQLFQRIGQYGRITAPYQLLRQNARGVGQALVRAWLDGIDSSAGIEIIERAAG